MEKVIQFLKDEDGVTAIEYGLIASLVAVAIVGGATALGLKLDSVFDFITGELKDSAPA